MDENKSQIKASVNLPCVKCGEVMSVDVELFGVANGGYTEQDVRFGCSKCGAEHKTHVEYETSYKQYNNEG